MNRHLKIAAVISLPVLLIGGALWLAGSLGWFGHVATPFAWPAQLTTIAGDGVRGSSDGPAARARFGDPFAIALEARGILYVADAGAVGRIRKLDPDGTVTTMPGAFDTPSGLAVDRAGNLYVAETGANAIRKISSAGVVSNSLRGGKAVARGWNPAALGSGDYILRIWAADRAGNVATSGLPITLRWCIRISADAGQQSV